MVYTQGMCQAGLTVGIWLISQSDICRLPCCCEVIDQGIYDLRSLGPVTAITNPLIVKLHILLYWSPGHSVGPSLRR